MNDSRLRALAPVAAAVGSALVVVAACSDLTGLPPATIRNVVDTVSLYALSDTVISLPAAYDLQTALAVRTDRSSLFDFAFNVDSTGRLEFLPSGALGL